MMMTAEKRWSFRDLVDTALAEWLAANQSGQCKINSPEGAMLAEGLLGIFRATRPVDTTGRQKG